MAEHENDLRVMRLTTDASREAYSAQAVYVCHAFTEGVIFLNSSELGCTSAHAVRAWPVHAMCSTVAAERRSDRAGGNTHGPKFAQVLPSIRRFTKLADSTVKQHMAHGRARATRGRVRMRRAAKNVV